MIGRLTVPLTTNKKIVSIVDNEIDITVLFRDALCTRMEGFSVVSFTDPYQALNHFRENKENYALVISDFRMPTIDGLGVLSQVKRLNPKVRSMLISAYEYENNPLFRKHLKKGIIDAFMDKPIKIARLCQRVREEFRLYQLRSDKK
jgi:DNA-binding NtrC family response regulator